MMRYVRRDKILGFESLAQLGPGNRNPRRTLNDNWNELNPKKT